MKCLGSVYCVTRLPSLSVASTWFSIEHGIVSVASSTRVLHPVVCAVRIIVGTIFGGSVIDVLVDALVCVVASTYIPVSAHDVFVFGPGATARWEETARTRRSLARA
jgi:hypothetical protein